MITFNKEQREGLAKVSYNLAVTSFVGAIVGITGHSQMQTVEIWCLVAAAGVLISASYFLRSTK